MAPLALKSIISGGTMENEQIPVAKPVAVEQPVVPTPNQGQPASAGQAANTSSPKAITALILGILSVLCMGFVTGIPAIIIGSMELKEIKAGKSPASGENITKIGYILGIVGTVLSCLAMLAIAAVTALGVSASSQMGQPV
jgi:Domain of unknown function (DUF4190)